MQRVMRCQICGCDMEGAGVLACGACGTPFHRDCWEFNGRCAVYGCGGRGATAWEGAPPEAGALEIREGTAPPFRLAPLVEALVRRLPRWGRAVVPPAFVGLFDGLLVLGVGTLVLGQGPSSKDVWMILGVAEAAVVLLTLLAPLTRRRPVAVLGGAVAVSVGVQALLKWAPVPRVGSDVVVVAFLLGVVAVAAALAEAVVMQRDVVRRLGGAARTAVHGLAAMGSVAVVAVVVLAARHLWEGGSLDDLVVLLDDSSLYWSLGLMSLFGLVAAAPTLALASSPLMYRLKAEARREAEEE